MVLVVIGLIFIFGGVAAAFYEDYMLSYKDYQVDSRIYPISVCFVIGGVVTMFVGMAGGV